MHGNVNVEDEEIHTPMTGWAGWIMFGGLIMVISGAFSVIWGLSALFNDKVFIVTKEKNVISLDYTAWGWAHLILGVLVIGTGLGLFAGATWARAVGVVLVMLSAIANLLVIGSYPIWSTIVIAMDILVLYAIIVHGRELKKEPEAS